MRARKKMDSYGSGARIHGSDTTYLYPANIGKVGHGSKVREGVVWWWGEGGAYFRVPTKTLLGKMSCWDVISPKKGKHKLKSLGAYYRG